LLLNGLFQFFLLDPVALGSAPIAPAVQDVREPERQGQPQLLTGELQNDIRASMAALQQAVAGQPVAQAWDDLMGAVAADVDELQGGRATIERQRELLARLAQAVRRMRITLTLPDAGSIADELSVLTGRLDRRVAVLVAAQALLDSPEASESLRNEVRDLLRNLADHELHASAETARAVMRSYRSLKDSRNAAAGSLADAVNNHYNHLNVRAIVSGSLLDRLARTTRTDSGPVRDFILGSDVFGDQTTTARVSARLLPNADAASYLVEAEGRTATETEGYPRQEGGEVVIHSRSTSRFIARRRVDLTADGLRAGEPVISVRTSNRVVGASTPYSSIPLLGQFADSIAMGEAEARRAEVEAIGASRVRDRVLPQFAAESDQRIAEMNENYRSVADRLAKRHAFPEVLSLASTATHLFALARTARHDELGGHEPLMWLPSDSLLTVQLHESAINNAFEHAELGGSTIDETSIGRLTAEAEGLVDGEPAPEQQEEPTISIKLADQDPVRIRLQDGLLRLQFHAAAVQKGEDRLMNQRLIVDYALEPLERTIRVVRRGEFDLQPLSDSEAPAQNQAAVARVRDALELIFLPHFELGATPALTDRQGEPIMLRLAKLSILDGWLSISLR
jgi:hypothetical protein